MSNEESFFKPCNEGGSSPPEKYQIDTKYGKIIVVKTGEIV